MAKSQGTKIFVKIFICLSENSLRSWITYDLILVTNQRVQNGNNSRTPNTAGTVFNLCMFETEITSRVLEIPVWILPIFGVKGGWRCCWGVAFLVNNIIECSTRFSSTDENFWLFALPNYSAQKSNPKNPIHGCFMS